MAEIFIAVGYLVGISTLVWAIVKIIITIFED
jgi:hypothetical protein